MSQEVSKNKEVVKILVATVFFLLIAVFAWVSEAKADDLDSINWAGGNVIYFGDGDDDDTIARGWAYRPAASHDICTMTARLRAVMNPIDSVQISIARWNVPYATSATTVPDTYSGFDVATIPSTKRNSDSSFQVRATTTLDTVPFTFTPCYTVVGGNWYLIWLNRTGALDAINKYESAFNMPNTDWSTYLTGTASWFNAADLDDYDITWGDKTDQNNGGLMVLNINGTENLSAVTPPDSNVAQCQPPSNILDVGGGISYSFCYLFVPSQTSVNQWANLRTLLSGKFPFAYFTDFSEAIDDISNPNGTSTPTFTYTASNTAISGLNINLGTAVTNTVGSSNLNTIRSIIATALWFALGAYYFFRIKNLIRT